MNDKILAEIAALLNKAENTDNEHEASAFMHAAQVKATRHAIDLATARAHTEKSQRRSQPTHERIELGQKGKHGLKHYVSLFLAIGRANDVTCNIAHNSTYVIAFGMPEDIEMTKTLYTSLVMQMVEASNRYLKTGAYKEEKVWRQRRVPNPDYEYGYWGDEPKTIVESGYFPVDARIARSSFQEAFAGRIGHRLMEARLEARNAAEEAEREQQAAQPAQEAAEPAESSTALVLKAKEVEVADYYKQNSTARGSYRPSRSKGSSSHARFAGREAGNRARLNNHAAIA